MQIVSYTNDGDNKLMFHLCVNIIIKRCLNKNTFFEPTTTYHMHSFIYLSLFICLSTTYHILYRQIIIKDYQYRCFPQLVTKMSYCNKP
jgi:hypothetical protein